MTPIFKNIAFGLAAGALLFTACGKPATDSARRTIPDAPDEAIRTVMTEFANGNGGILWQAMPASYQNDITDLMHLAGSKIDPEIYDQSFATIAHFAEVLDQQQVFILNSTFMQQQSAEQLARLEAALPSIVGLIETFVTSDLASANGLLHFDGQAFFDTTVSQFTEYCEALAQLAGEASVFSGYDQAVLAVLEANDLEATVQMTVPGQASYQAVFTRVEQRWVPADIASEWPATIAQAIANLEATSVDTMRTQKPQIMAALTMMDGVLTQIAAAETQAQFDQSLKGAIMPLMGLLLMGQGLGGMQSAAEPPEPATPVTPSGSNPVQQ